MARDTKDQKPKRDLYQEVTDKILALLDQGVPPWRQPITTADGPGMPTSFGTKKPYRGINLFLLAINAWAHNYASNYWLTFNQAKQLNAKVPEGRKNYSKTKPMQFEEFADCLKWFRQRQRSENDHAWKIPASDVLKYGANGALLSCNLDIKNPNSAESLEHLPPEQLVADILQKERRIIEIMQEIEAELARAAR